MKRIDHIIIKVGDLHDGVREFTEAGFKVYYGTQKEKAYNALIYLQDDSFLELLDTRVIPRFGRVLTQLGVLRLVSPFYNRLGNYFFKPGPFLDYPIYTATIDTSHAHAQGQRTRIVEGKRQKPNGTVVSWRCFAPNDINLPFVMSDYTPEKMSADETDVHPNGITGLHTMNVAFAGGVAVFKERLLAFYQVGTQQVQGEGNGFSVQTENALIRYTQADEHRITAVMLTPANPTVDERLGKFGLGTAVKT